MTLASAFAFLLCSQRFRPPSSFPTTLAQTYDGVPMSVLDQPLVDKIHTPSVNPKVHGRMGYRRFTFAKHPLFADVFVPAATPNPLTAGCSQLLTSNLYQLLFTKRYGEDHS